MERGVTGWSRSSEVYGAHYAAPVSSQGFPDTAPLGPRVPHDAPSGDPYYTTSLSSGPGPRATAALSITSALDARAALQRLPPRSPARGPLDRYGRLPGSSSASTMPPTYGVRRDGTYATPGIARTVDASGRPLRPPAPAMAPSGAYPTSPGGRSPYRPGAQPFHDTYEL
jgi:hypothetical protein